MIFRPSWECTWSEDPSSHRPTRSPRPQPAQAPAVAGTGLTLDDPASVRSAVVRLRSMCRMRTWGQTLTERYLAVERVAGAGRPRTRLQKWVSRHPVRLGVYIAVPMTIGGLLVAEKPGSVVVVLIAGPVFGAIYSLMAIMDRVLRSRIRRRMGLDSDD